MNILLLDTSLQGALLGVAELQGKSGRLLHMHQTAVPQEAAAALPELCEKLLGDAGLRRDDIDVFVAGVGPGSFTGIKIGLSFALGWKTARPTTRIYGVSAFRGFVKQAKEQALWALPATQKAGYFFAKTGDLAMGTIDLDDEPVFFLPSEKGARPWTVPDSLPVRIIGSWPKLEEFADKKQWERHRLDVLSIGSELLAGMLEEFVANSENLSEGELKPLYLRKSAPEEKAEKEKKQTQPV